MLVMLVLAFMFFFVMLVWAFVLLFVMFIWAFGLFLVILSQIELLSMLLLWSLYVSFDINGFKLSRQDRQVILVDDFLRFS